ncbi:MAG: hypothetical protein AAGF53_18210 [Pseudomonadota bacterium]
MTFIRVADDPALRSCQLRALADPTRFQIHCLVSERAHRVGELAELCPGTRWSVQKKINELANAQLVTKNRIGRFVMVEAVIWREY